MASRIGVFGGTFDPPHIGHLFAAASVAYELQLDEMLLIVAHDPWQKSGTRPVSDAESRLEMVTLACAGVAPLQASRIELDRGGATYTADTLEHLAGKNPAGDAELFLVVGSDAAAGLGTWKRPDTVRELATTVVLDRPGPGAGGRPPDGWDHVVVPLPLLEVSGTTLRDRVATGRPINFLTPAAVVDYIAANDLYRGSP